MRQIKKRRGHWLFLWFLTITAVCLMPVGAWGQAIQMSAGPVYPPILVAGQTGVPVHYDIQNGTGSTESIKITTSPATQVVRYQPACSGSAYGPTGSPSAGCSAGLGESPILVGGTLAIVPSATGTGSGPNPTCAQTWTFTFISNTEGYALTAPNPLVLAVGELCQINFTINVNSGTPAGTLFGTGYATAQGNVTSTLTGFGAGSTQTTIQNCAVAIDKQVSCDGGTTWQDVSITNGTATTTDDANNASTLGCLQRSGANVQERVLVKNSGTSAATCTLTDTPTLTFNLPPGVTSTTGFSLGVSATPLIFTVNPFACNLTGTASGSDTASVSCSCATSTNTITLNPVTDTATYACTSVTVDKQISCNADATTPTFVDVGQETSNNDGTNGCVAPVFSGANNHQPSNVSAQYAAQNNGNVSLNCTLTDNNTSFIATNRTINPLAPGAVTPIGTPTAAQTCMAAKSHEPNGGDTATLTCQPILPTGVSNPLGLGSTVALTATDSANFDCCGVQIEKQVNCGTGGALTSFIPATPVFDTNDTDPTGASCTTVAGQPVAIRYQVLNAGSLPLTCNGTGQGITDLAGTTVIQPLTGIASFPVSSTAVIVPNTGTLAPTSGAICGSTLNTAEATAGDLASITCQCAGSATSTTANTVVTASDAGKIQCPIPPSFTVQKTCVPNPTVANTFTATVTVNNTTPSGGGSIACTLASDQTFPGDCPVGSFPTGTGTAVPVANFTPALGTIAAGSSASTTDAGFTTTSTVCNVASVSCTSGGAPVCPPGVSAPCAIQAEATCNVVSGCFTRTPGFWGTHPLITEQLLPLSVCGITLNNVADFQSGSAIEDLCINNADAKANHTTMQQLQLIRQCASAALNLKASSEATSPALNCNSAFPNINNTFAACCTGTRTTPAVCDNGGNPPTANSMTMDQCTSVLDAFNNQFDSTDFPSFLIGAPGSASPDACQIANGNGFINPGRNLQQK